MNRTACFALASLLGSGALTGVAPLAAQSDREEVAVNRPAYASSYDAEIPRGTEVPVTLSEDVPIEQDRMGDTFDARVTRDVIVDGDVVIAAGAPAKVRLVESSEKKDAATLRLVEVRVDDEMQSVVASEARTDSEKSGWSTRKKTAVGAAAGAVLGAVTGAGVLRGAVVGAGGGLAWGLIGGRDREVKGDTPLLFSLEDDVDVR